MAFLRKISFWFLALYLLFSVGKDLQTMMANQRGTDYFIFQIHNQISLFYAILTITFLLDLVASYFLFYPRPTGFWVILAALLLSPLYNVLVTRLAMKDLEGVKQAYLTSRELRGLLVTPENLNRIFTREGMLATVAIACVFSLLALASLWLNRQAFNVVANEVGSIDS